MLAAPSLLTLYVVAVKSVVAGMPPGNGMSKSLFIVCRPRTNLPRKSGNLKDPPDVVTGVNGTDPL